MVLNGAETLFVDGVAANGAPSGSTFQTTTGAIAQLAGASPYTSSVINFLSWSPSSMGVTSDQTTIIQNFLLYCQRVALTLKNLNLDDQGQRLFVTAYFPRGYYNISCPIVVPSLVNLHCDGFIIRTGTSGTTTNTYTGDTTTKALANLYMPAVIITPKGHSTTSNMYCESNGTDLGAGLFVGKTWTAHAVAIGKSGSGYSVNDVLTLANPDNSPYLPITATVASVDGNGGITGLSLTSAGAYGLPPVLQTQQWTTANSFFVFDVNGNFLTTGGNGSGATVGVTWTTDWSNGNTNYNMGASGLTSDYLIKHQRIEHVNTTTDTTYGPMIACNLFGLNFEIDGIELQGGATGFNWNSAADIRAVNLNSVGSNNAFVLYNCNNVVATSICIDTPGFWLASIDLSQGVVMKGRAFNRNRFNYAGSQNYAFLIGANSSSGSGNDCEGLDLDFQLTNCGSGGAPLGCPALYLAYTRGSTINLNITNFTSASGIAPINSFVTFGSGVDSSNQITGQLDGTVSSVYTGTFPNCYMNVWVNGAVAGSLAQRSAIAGLILSNDGVSPNSVLDISAGQATDSSGLFTIALASFTKSTAGSWTAGSGSNGMGTGLTVGNNTWYHVFLILNNTTPDIYFDTSVSAANAPTGTIAYRRIGSFKTNGSAQILPFVQDEETFYWGTVVQDVSVTNLPNTATLYTLSTPLGVKTRPIFRYSSNNNTLLTSPDEADAAAQTTLGTSPGFDANNSLTGGIVGPFGGTLYTNTSSQIRARAQSNNATITIITRGWIDSRGRFG